MTEEEARQERDTQRRIRHIVRQCRHEKIQFVRFLYCGNDGVIRGKACTTEFLDSYLVSGIGLTVAMQCMNMLDQLVPDGSFGPVGEIRLMADPTTFAILPYVPRSARVLLRHADRRRRSLGRLPAQLPQAHDRARGRPRAGRARRLRERVHPGPSRRDRATCPWTRATASRPSGWTAPRPS